MQASNVQPPHLESTKTLQNYLSNNYNKSLVACLFILMFAMVFHLIYLLLDHCVDKNMQYKYALALQEKREAKRRKREALLKRNARKRSHHHHHQSSDEHENSQAHDNDDEAQDEKEKRAKRASAIDFILWTTRNLHISFIHSFLCSIWLIRISVLKTEMFSDLLAYVSWDTYLFVAFSCGYFLYDFYDIYATGHLRTELVVCMHHWIVLISFGYHLIHLLNIGYTVLALYMEFNSVFLHARKLLRFYGYGNETLTARVNKVLNLITFVVFRFGALAMIAYGISVDGHRVTSGYLTMLITCTVGMALINIVLFYHVLRTDWLPDKHGKTYTHHQEIMDDDLVPTSELVLDAQKFE